MKDLSAGMDGSVDQPSIDTAVMREVLGHFVSGIVVVTAVDGDGPLGFTCQSFTSLSLDPPLILLSPALTSKSWPRIRGVGRFCVNVLAEGHSEHSRNFARTGNDRFAGVQWSPAPSGSPVLDGVSAWIDCTLHGEFDGGDHSIVLGRVTALGANPGRLPLLYYRGVYHGTAPLAAPTSPATPQLARTTPGSTDTATEPGPRSDRVSAR